MKRGVVEVELHMLRTMCNVEQDPFAFNLIDEFEQGDIFQRFGMFDVNSKNSNLDPDEVGLYLLVVLFSSFHFGLVIRYLLRLQ